MTAQRASAGGRAGWPRGLTTVELIVVLALLGLVTGLSGPALAGLLRPRASVPLEMQRLRAAAIRSGRSVSDSGAMFFPDGRVIGAGLDPLTGAQRP